MKKLIIASICVALGVVLSTTSIPVGTARIFPFQHMINVILAVVVGARFSVGAAFSTSCLRNVLALGSPLAFPGSMIGACNPVAFHWPPQYGLYSSHRIGVITRSHPLYGCSHDIAVAY